MIGVGSLAAFSYLLTSSSYTVSILVLSILLSCAGTNVVLLCGQAAALSVAV